MQWAIAEMRVAGAANLPAPNGLAVQLVYYCTILRDIDSSDKLVLDTIKYATSVDDKYVFDLRIKKVPVKRRELYRMVVEVKAL